MKSSFPLAGLGQVVVLLFSLYILTGVIGKIGWEGLLIFSCLGAFALGSVLPLGVFLYFLVCYLFIERPKEKIPQKQNN